MSGAANAAGRPVVAPSPLTRGFWDAARDHRLVVQRCMACAAYRHYPQLRCPACLSADWSWTAVSGFGTVYTFSVSHRAFSPAWADAVPYVVATIELNEGVRMVSDLPPEDTEIVAIGRAAEVFFDNIGDVVLPRFRLVR